MAAFVLSYAYIEKGLCPYRFYFCIIKVSQGRCPRTPTNFCVQKFDKKLFFFDVNSFTTIMQKNTFLSEGVFYIFSSLLHFKYQPR